MPFVNDLAPLSIPAGVPALLRDLIHERTGTFFDEARLDIMIEKLQDLPRVLGCHSLLDYYYILKYDQPATGEWRRVLDALSVQETYFWREISQIEYLVKTLAPRWFAKTRAPLRLWSAACATGEEPYTILMALLEAGFDSAQIQIEASDASESALHKARQAIYRERSFRSLPKPVRDKYFTKAASGFQFDPALAAKITFHQANIISASDVSRLATAPIIFCRNVFIYFSQNTIRRAVKTFAESQPADAHLFVGASESLLNLTHEYVLEEIPGAFVYLKKAPAPNLNPT